MKGQTNTQYPQNNISARVRYFSSLTVSQQKLVLIFKQIQWGSIQYLTFYAGEPILKPSPKVNRIIILDNPIKQTKEQPTNFELKQPLVSFFDYLEQQQSGCIKHIEIRDGLPAKMSVDEVE